MGQLAVNSIQREDFEKPDGLKSAFELFNEMSAQLANSYDALQSRVLELNQELSTVSAQRLQELAQKEKLANRLETLLNVLPGGVIVLDAFGKITEANPASRDMLSEPLVGCLWRQIIERNFSPKADDGHEVSTLDGRRYSIATRSLDGDGQIILLTDQTQTRHLQEQLSRHERLSSLGKMVAALAHQIRTPLSAALLYSSHLTELDGDVERSQICAEKIRGRLLHMEQQVKDMLFFVKGELPLPDIINLQKLKDTLEEAVEAALKQRNVTCQWIVKSPDFNIKINLEAISGAVQNLVDNALQADSEAKPIAITLEPFLNDALAISVLDQGPGLPEEIADSVCDIFVTNKAQGTGLGLAVVQQVAKAHSGKFTIRSIKGKGTRASLILPVLYAQSQTSSMSEVKA
ncbi:ATP-binding protein [Simiduia litorea]|uniref:sensor histidine kinase n=1 Tax=Simiduia litorea TaxID=1435348 RepID=UPI0036F42494